MANQFSINPLGGLNLSAAADNILNPIRQNQMMDRRNRQREILSQVMQTGTPEERINFLAMNPEIQQEFQALQGHKDENTKRARISGIRRILAGGDPYKALEDTAASIEQYGGDASDTRELLSRSPEEIRQAAEVMLPFYDAGAAQSLMRGRQSRGIGSSGTSGGKVGTYNPRDYTVESWSEFVKTGQPGVLKRFTPKPQSKLTAHGEKVLTDAQQRFFDSGTQAREYELLANDYQSFADNLPTGVVASMSEFIKRVAGSQDEATELRRRFAKVRLSEALKYLPPGPATDRDVAEAFKGVPPDNASPEQVQSFLRGAAKMADVDAEFQEFKANYISENNNTQGMIGEWKKAIKDGRVESINALNQEGSQVTRETVDTPQGSATAVTVTSGSAPPQAIQYLQQNPQFAEQFKAKYGYLPEGM